MIASDVPSVVVSEETVSALSDGRSTAVCSSWSIAFRGWRLYIRKKGLNFDES